MRTVSYEFGSSLPISVQLILWSQLIFNYEVRINEMVTNPLRRDNTPNCWLHITKFNRVELNDFNLSNHIKSYSKFGLSLYDAIKLKYNLDSYNAVEKFITEFVSEQNINFSLVKSPVIDRKICLTYE